MKIEPVTAEVFQLTEVPALDPVTVILMDFGDGKGRVVLECFGDCFSAYWGSMGMPLRQFVSGCGEDYLENNFIGRLHKLTKPQRGYLRRIITAVKKGLK